ncbi:SpoIIE family protein phosphatase [Chloroflexia bacterium SDU3-3]|nr:SpoIIE family protein phosphatase [Chloroflexia bacterium SDU3-3]
MRRESWLIIYCVCAGALGWVLLLAQPLHPTSPQLLWLLALALLVESTGFRAPPADSVSLVGVVLLTAALVLGPADGALLAALSGLVFGTAAPLFYRRAKTPFYIFARPFLRSGVRALGVLGSYGAASALAGPAPSLLAQLVALLVCYPAIIHLNRVIREYIQGGPTGVGIWWRSTWRSSLSTELLPLPIAWLGAAIYLRLGSLYMLLAGAGLFVVGLTVRRATRQVQSQRRSVQELALLNQVSRAIIRADMDVGELCELIYREASKLVDTSSFHLGLFAAQGDQYTLVVRVQQRVRLDPISMDLPMGDGIVGWMRETGQSLLVEDFELEMEKLPARPRYQSDHPPRSGIYVPLSDGEHVIGTISIQSYRPRAFDINDMRMLSLIADQAAVAISKARVFDQASKRARQLQAIHSVGEQITAILDMDELLPSVVSLIRERFGYHPVHIFSIEPDGRLLFRASTAESEGRSRLTMLHTGQGLIGVAAQSSMPLLVNDVAADPRYISDDPNTCAELAVPLRFGAQNLGVLDVQSDTANAFTNDDMFIMQTLAGQIAVAIESARAFQAQREEAWTLNALLQVAENLARASTLEDLLPTIVRLPPLLLGCTRCYCWEWDAAHGHFAPLAAYGLADDQRKRFFATLLDDASAPMLAEARDSAGLVAACNVEADMRRLPSVVELGGGTLVAHALMARNLPLGALVLDYESPRHDLPPRTQAMITGIANQIASALEAAFLAIDAAQAAHLEEELRVAREIQTALLPSEVPHIPGWGIAADWRSARLVGGDFYDFWPLHGPDHQPQIEQAAPILGQSEKLGFVIADVSDKGVPAAMFMALSRSLVRAAALDGSSASTALMRANRWITRDSDSAMFVTLFYGILELQTGCMRFSCAGHNPPLLVRADGSVEELKTPGIALGVLEEARLYETAVDFHPGDVLVCYTDGITEAINNADEEFGVPRLTEVIRQQREASADAIRRAIGEALGRFTEGRPPFDDITMVIIKREPTA